MHGKEKEDFIKRFSYPNFGSAEVSGREKGKERVVLLKRWRKLYLSQLFF